MPRKKEKCACGGEKSHGSEFCRSCRGKTSEDGSKMTRAEYARDWTLQKKYGITLDDFHGYWIVSRGRCGICDIYMKPPAQRQGQAMDVVAVDHDHATGKVRGLLCNACNKGLGHFKDDPALLQKAMEYLK